MGRTRSISLDGTGAAVEYVRSRRVLRVAGPAGGDALEFEPAAFLHALGVELTDIVPSQQFLLFAGSNERVAGGLGDLVDVFSCEEQARERFLQLRLSPGTWACWAELAALDICGGIKSVCWFGRPRGDSGRQAERAPIDREGTRAPRRFRLVRARRQRVGRRPG